MHTTPKDNASYDKNIDAALDNSFLRTSLDNFAKAYKENREQVCAHINAPEIIAQIAKTKDHVAQNIEKYYAQFKKNAEARGVHVHLAQTAEEANALIAHIAKKHGVHNIVKSKSMTSEETQLNAHLESEGYTVQETDLGEYIIQLRNEGPSHMVMPAIHLSRYEVAQDFSKVTGQIEHHDIDHLVRVARRRMRSKFITADMGITGGNFAVAETGSFAICTNEGNGRLVSTLPPIHVALMGLDKLMPTFEDVLNALLILPRNATAQLLTAYVTWFSGAGSCHTAKDATKISHIIFLDNGRTALAKDPLFAQIFRCVRCGACANVCPIYRLIGGHNMGHIYIGAIGLILTYFFHSHKHAHMLAQNCIQCHACKHICAGGIDLPTLINEIKTRLMQEYGTPAPARVLGMAMKNRTFFHKLLTLAKYAQIPFSTGKNYQRHLPSILFGEHNFKTLPVLAAKPFRHQWPIYQKSMHKPRYKIALFAGCAQDFIYPEQLRAAVDIFTAHNIACDFPLEQSCCGLPLEMMGQESIAQEVALQNISAFAHEEYDAIITLCASCASHLKHGYPKLMNKSSTAPITTQECAHFTNKIMDFSSFVYHVLGLSHTDFRKSALRVAYHASCHLCRGLDVRKGPRELIEMAATYVPSQEEEHCCGFGGTYSLKFPQISKNILQMKLDNIQAAKVSHLVVDCPGCIMQLRGGAHKQEQELTVLHMAELLSTYIR